jgi:hypothetical protein
MMTLQERILRVAKLSTPEKKRLAAAKGNVNVQNRTPDPDLAQAA